MPEQKAALAAPSLGAAAPRLRPDRVRRSRLVERLERGAAGRLVTVVAPAGFGKTTLIADWLLQSKRRYAWLSVEPGMEGPGELLAGLDAAVGRALGGPVGRGAAALPEALALSIASRIADSGSGLVLVVDDFHRAEQSGAGRAAARLAELLPPGSCLVLASRSGPSFREARLRASGELEEIGAEELRFTSAEAREFLSRAALPRLSDEDASILGTRTEGWIAALQLAVLALRDGRDPRAFVEAFGGTTRSVYDFLAEEAIDAMPDADLEFLVAASVVERFCAPLCAVLLGAGGAGGAGGAEFAEGPTPEDRAAAHERASSTLARLERDCLFLAPLDDERRWYRLHTLFREALLGRLRSRGPERERELRRAASRWLEAEGRPAEALRQAALAGEVERTAALAERFALAALESGDIGEIRAALAALRAAHSAGAGEALGGPWLELAAAWAAAYAGDLREAEARAAAAIAARGSPPAEGDEAGAGEDAGERREWMRVEGHALGVRAYAACQEASSRQAVDLAARALGLLPESDVMARGHVEMTMGSAYFLLAHDGEAREALGRAMALGGAGGCLHVRQLAAACLAEQMLALGDLDGAKALCLSVAEEPGAALSPALGCVLTALGKVHWERSETAEALETARRGLELCLRWGHAESLVGAYMVLGDCLAAAGDPDAALALLDRAGRLEPLSDWQRFNLEEVAASILVQKGDWRGAEAFCTRPRSVVDTYENNFTVASWLIAKKRPTEALPLLDRCRERCERRGLATRRVEAYILYALARRARGERRAALDALSTAVAEAAPMGASRRFVRRGAPVLDLVDELRSERRDEFLELLHDALSESVSRPGDRAEGALSPREVEILRLMAEGRTAEEAADRLCVAPSTVRSHVKAIYAKLGAHRRLEAIKRARELGLL